MTLICANLMSFKHTRLDTILNFFSLFFRPSRYGIRFKGDFSLIYDMYEPDVGAGTSQVYTSGSTSD